MALYRQGTLLTAFQLKSLLFKMLGSNNMGKSHRKSTKNDFDLVNDLDLDLGSFLFCYNQKVHPHKHILRC